MLAGDWQLRLENRGHPRTQEFEENTGVPSLVAGVEGVASGELGRRAPAEANWVFCPRAISGGIDKGNGFLRAPGVCWWREQSGKAVVA